MMDMWKDVRGSFSIIFVIVAFVGALTITAFVDMLSRSFLIGEVQSMMDIAGTTALRMGVDEVYLRAEEFRFNRNEVEIRYRQMIDEQLRNSPKILNYKFVDLDVSAFNSTFGLGETRKSRWQGMIDSTIMVQIEQSPVFDLIPGVSESFYDARSSTYFHVSYAGQTEDGRVELLVRSVTRIVYR